MSQDGKRVNPHSTYFHPALVRVFSETSAISGKRRQILAFGTAMLAFPLSELSREGSDASQLCFAPELCVVAQGRYPLAPMTFALGIVLVILGDWNLWKNEWLPVSIVPCLATVADAQLITLPPVGRLAQLTDRSNDANAKIIPRN